VSRMQSSDWLRLLSVPLILSGFVSPDFPNGFFFFPVGVFLVLLTLRPEHRVGIRVLHFLVAFFLGVGQLAHFLFIPAINEACKTVHVLVCIRVSAHTLLAEIIGTCLLISAWPAICQPADSLRRAWQMARFGIGAIGFNVLYAVFITVFSTVGRDPVFPDDKLWGFPVHPSPPLRDFAFFTTGIFWLLCAFAMAPERREGWRKALGIPPLEEETKAAEMV